VRRGRDRAEKIGTEKSYITGKIYFLNFKGTPSREERKTSFSVLKTIEMNLLVEFTILQTTGSVQLI
jgi:hypothetical protein